MLSNSTDTGHSRATVAIRNMESKISANKTTHNDTSKPAITFKIHKETPPMYEGAKVAAVKAVKKSGAITTANGKSSPAPSSGKSSPTLADKKTIRDAGSVAKEQAADVDEETLQEVYGKEHVNLIF